jgi:hypothetical protein
MYEYSEIYARKLKDKLGYQKFIQEDTNKENVNAQKCLIMNKGKNP